MNDDKNRPGGMPELRCNDSNGSKRNVTGQPNELSDDITGDIITLVAVNSDGLREFLCAGRKVLVWSPGTG